MATTEFPSTSIALASLIRVRQGSIRSISVERDLQNNSIVENYLLTSQSRRSLSRILNSLLGPTPTRAWTVTGPYGSGKSYFAIFLMNLICAAHPGHGQAVDLLQSIDPLLNDQFITRFQVNTSNGYLAVPISGSRSSLQECLVVGFTQALRPYIQNAQISDLLTKLNQWDSTTDSRTIIAWIQEAKIALVNLPVPFRGILIVLDEMGKTLEYAATNPERADVYLFQELAELANRSGDFPIVFIGILHQAFERYASLMNTASQREWAKVQGRFEDIAFQEPPIQQMHLLARTLEAINLDRFASLYPILQKNAEEAARSGWKPALVKREEFIELAVSTYPFHPSAMTALPLIFKRLAQNERSLFAFLTSAEPYALQDFLHNHKAPEYLRLHNLFDYLVANFQGRLFASSRARQITETLERLNNAPNLDVLEVELLKTIGLINWLAESGAIQATDSAIVSALRGDGRADDDIHLALRRMKDQSLIVFRRYNGTYNIWQGSDVDIEARLDEAHQRLTGNFSFSEIIQRYLPPHPIVARRHSYETGALRYFETRYIDTFTYQDTTLLDAAPGSSGVVLLALPTNQTDIDTFSSWACSDVVRTRSDILIGIAGRSLRLVELTQELRALNWISDNTPELRDDPVARRELRTRLALVEALITTELDKSLKLHRLAEAENCEWYWRGQPIENGKRDSLSHLLSSICDSIYDQSPRIWNELINRHSLSSQAAGARRNLIEGMLTRSTSPTLSIEGYPPERSMYESVLKKSGVHTFNENTWCFQAPPPDDPLKLLPVWNAIDEYIFTPPSEPRPVSNLFDLLKSPPYGVSAGVQPVLLCAFLLVHASETTLYKEGTLLPEARVADWEVLLRRPELFSVAGCRVEGPLRKILERIGRGFRVEPKVMPVVRVLVRSLKTLPDHAWRTQRLSQEALTVRHLIDSAHSPEYLLFHELPISLHLDPFDQVPPSDEQISLFFERLNAALEDLAMATPRLQDWARDLFLEACSLPAGNQGWEQFRGLCGELSRTSYNPTLTPLIKRTLEGQTSQLSLESVLALIGNRPLRLWADIDTDRFAAQAQSFGELFQKELRSFKPESRLSPKQQERCQLIAANVRNVLVTEFGNDPDLIESALLALAKDLMQLTDLVINKVGESK